MATCVYCGNDVSYAFDRGVGWADKTLITAEDGAVCPDPSALDGPGALVGQDPTHALEDGVGAP
jgi:hypothetical protein